MLIPYVKNQEPHKNLPTLFTTLRQRYLHRPGGYTRVLRIEPRNRHHDQAPSAILELVDGPRDMRFAMVAKTLVRERAAAGDGDGDGEGGGIREITARNVAKVTRFREGGEEELERTVRRLETMAGLGEEKEKEKEKDKEKGKEEKDEEEEEEEEEEKEEKEERQPWEPFARMRQRQRDEAERARPLTAREKREIRRPKRDPNTGRRDERRRRRTGGGLEGGGGD